MRVITSFLLLIFLRLFSFCNFVIVYHTDHFRFLLLLLILTLGSSVSSTGVLDIKDHCNKTVEIYEEISGPELTHLNRNRPLLCTYRFRSFRGAPRDWVLRIRFKKFKVGNILNATHCDGGYLQVITKQFHLCKRNQRTNFRESVQFMVFLGLLFQLKPSQYFLL